MQEEMKRVEWASCCRVADTSLTRRYQIIAETKSATDGTTVP